MLYRPHISHIGVIVEHNPVRTRYTTSLTFHIMRMNLHWLRGGDNKGSK